MTDIDRRIDVLQHHAGSDHPYLSDLSKRKLREIGDYIDLSLEGATPFIDTSDDHMEVLAALHRVYQAGHEGVAPEKFRVRGVIVSNYLNALGNLARTVAV